MKILFDAKEVQVKVLEMLGSEEYKKALENTWGADNTCFKSGAMFGAAFSSIYVATHAQEFCQTTFCRCKECIYRTEGHPTISWLPCRMTNDYDFCSYGSSDLSEKEEEKVDPRGEKS